MPLGPQVGPERVGTMDVAATLDQLFLAAYVLVIVSPDLRIRRGMRTLLGVHRMRIGMMVCSATVFAGRSAATTTKARLRGRGVARRGPCCERPARGESAARRPAAAKRPARDAAC